MEINNIFLFFIIFITAIVVSGIFIPKIVLISKKKRWFDTPNERSSHTKRTPRLGGVVFFPSIILPVGVYILLRTHFGIWTEELNIFIQNLLPLLSGLLILYIVGIIDDLKGLGFEIKLPIQIIGALILVLGVGYINPESLPLFLDLNGFSTVGLIIFTTFSIVSIINAINLIDGIDGLASGLTILASITYCILFFIMGSYAEAALSIALVGVLIPFFCYNVYGKRLKLFMGDTGSLIIGFILSYQMLVLCQTPSTFFPAYLSNGGIFVLVFSTLFIPIFDVFRVFIGRISQKKSPFKPDKTHIHHLLLDLGLGHRQTMLLLIACSALIIFVNWILLLFMSPWLVFMMDLCLGLAFSFFLLKQSLKK